MFVSVKNHFIRPEKIAQFAKKFDVCFVRPFYKVFLFDTRVFYKLSAIQECYYCQLNFDCAICPVKISNLKCDLLVHTDL